MKRVDKMEIVAHERKIFETILINSHPFKIGSSKKYSVPSSGYMWLPRDSLAFVLLPHSSEGTLNSSYGFLFVWFCFLQTGSSYIAPAGPQLLLQTRLASTYRDLPALASPVLGLKHAPLHPAELAVLKSQLFYRPFGLLVYFYKIVLSLHLINQFAIPQDSQTWCINCCFYFTYLAALLPKACTIFLKHSFSFIAFFGWNIQILSYIVTFYM